MNTIEENEAGHVTWHYEEIEPFDYHTPPITLTSMWVDHVSLTTQAD